MKKDTVKQYKYTIRLNDRDDADLLRVLEGKNVSKTFREALRGTVNKEDEIDELVTQKVARHLYDILTGFQRLSDLFIIAGPPLLAVGGGAAPPVSDLRAASVAAGPASSESAAPTEATAGPKQAQRPRSAPPEDQVELFEDPAQPAVSKETATCVDADKEQKALQNLKKCAFAMLGKPAPEPSIPPIAEPAADQAPKDQG